jgi:hypothetical protein
VGFFEPHFPKDKPMPRAIKITGHSKPGEHTGATVLYSDRSTVEVKLEQFRNEAEVNYHNRCLISAARIRAVESPQAKLLQAALSKFREARMELETVVDAIQTGQCAIAAYWADDEPPDWERGPTDRQTRGEQVHYFLRLAARLARIVADRELDLRTLPIVEDISPASAPRAAEPTPTPKPPPQSRRKSAKSAK